MALALSAMGGCAPQIMPEPSPQLAVVTARGETEPVGTQNADAADDPAIWRNAANPKASLIVATDKKAGLYVYAMDGKVRSFLDAGRVNNVDLFELPGEGIIVAASDRNDESQAMLALFRLDPQTAILSPIGKVKAGKGEAYGICLASGKFTGGGPKDITAISVLKNGKIRQMLLTIQGDNVAKGQSRELSVPTQPEGCVADEKSGHLYIGEEDAGIWQFPLNSTAAAEGKIVAAIDNIRLTADVEGLAIIEQDKARYLIASSQGDNSYALFTLPDMRFAGNFVIGDGPAIGGTSETDGIAVMAGSFGDAYPGGLFVAQDGDNGTKPQNFKLVSWTDIRAALKLK